MSDGCVTVAQCVEGLPPGRFVWELVLCALLLWLMLGAINEMTPLTFAAVSGQWKGDDQGTAMIFASAAFGNFLAVLGGGWVADRYGRVAVIKPALLLTVSCSLVLQSARTLSQAVIARFLLGIVSGALINVVPTLIAEWLPSRNRGFYLTVWCSGWPAGALLSLLVGCLSPALNWRAFHAILLVPTIVVYICLRADMLPESPRYLYLVGRRDEGYNTLLDVYEKEELLLPWSPESIAVTCAPLPKSEPERSTLCHSVCKTATPANTTVAVWLAATMFLISAASQSLKLWMPALLLSQRTSIVPGAAVSFVDSQKGWPMALWTGGDVAQNLTSLMQMSGTRGVAMSLLSIAPRSGAPSEREREIVILLSQAYVVHILGIVLCAYASAWVRRKQLIQWSLAAATLLTLLTLGAAQSGAIWLCGPLLGLQLAAQSCSLNFLQAFAAEHFPTARRAKVVAGVVFASQLGDFVMPLVGAVIVGRISRAGALLLFSALYVLAWIVSHRLPLPTCRERSLHDVDEPRCQREENARNRKHDLMAYQTL